MFKFYVQPYLCTYLSINEPTLCAKFDSKITQQVASVLFRQEMEPHIWMSLEWLLAKISL